jgi:hypothetical protein
VSWLDIGETYLASFAGAFVGAIIALRILRGRWRA